MKRNYWLTLSAAALFGMTTLGGIAQAQDTPSSTPKTQQPPDTQAPAPQQTAPAQTPDQSGQTPSSSSQPSATPDQSTSGTSEYVGTVVKQGDKYVFQEAASGQTYDIDHQDEVKKFEGKKVRVKGTLDPSTKTIHVQ